MARMLAAAKAAGWKYGRDYYCCSRHFPGAKAKAHRAHRKAERRRWRKDWGGEGVDGPRSG
jgi:hypothetical protein